jgi:TPR repeat protein
MAISVFGTAFLVFFGAGFLIFRPHGIRLGEMVRFLRRKLLEWTERMALSASTQSEESADALYFIGKRHRSADGVPQDYEKAVFLFRRAAELGDARAQLELGNLYSEGKGVSQDYALAVVWYRKAAEQGNSWAQYILGDLYEKGNGLSQDYVEAYFWYSLASIKIDPVFAQTSLAGKGPKKHRDDVESHLSPTELTYLQERVRKWIEAYPAKPQ